MSTSTIPLYGQAYELTVGFGDNTTQVFSSSSWEPEALRITFDVVQSSISECWWYADISIYNLDSPTIKNALLNAQWAQLKAGFQYGPTQKATIWNGRTYQVTLTREGVVDEVLTLHCIALPPEMDGVVNMPVGPWAQQQQVVASMVDAIGLPPISAANGTQSQLAQDRMTNKTLPRGDTLFGKPSRFLGMVADDNYMQFFTDGSKAYMSDVVNPNTTPSIIYAAAPQPGVLLPDLPAGVTASILGTPRQIPQGVVFTVLLDPRLLVKIPPMMIQIDQSSTIAQLTIQPSANSQLVSPLSNDLSFFVTQLRHTGDSRGNNWQTEVTGYSTTYAKGLSNGLWSVGA